MFVRIVALIVLLLAGLWGFVTFSKVPSASGSDTASAAWLAHSFYDVGYVDLTLKDRSRPTSKNKEYGGDDDREFTGGLWYPAVEEDAVAPGKHPLVVFSHGFGSKFSSGEYLAENLASRGYIVLSMNYPLTNFDAPGGPMVRDIANQPGDVKFFIDSMLAMNMDKDSFLNQKIDPNSIGAIGISLGGMTTTMAAFHPSKGDDRIKAAVSLAGPSAMFSDKFYRFNPVPFLMIAADQDALINYETNARPITERVEGATLITLKGGSHIGFSSLASYLRWLNNPDIVACWAVMKNLDESDNESWGDIIGTPDEGLIEVVEIPACPEELPKSMNPLRQQQLTQMAVASFFEMFFAQTHAERNRAKEYFSVDFATENSDIVFEMSNLKAK